MEIAISSIVIIILLLPGISFNKGFYSGEFSRQYLANDFFSLLVNTLFPSTIFYIITLPLIYIFGYYYDFNILLGLISSNDDLVEKSINLIDKFILDIFIFQIVLNVLAFIIGILLRNLVLKYSYDTKYPIFRFNNVWHYLISGRFLEYKEILQNDTPEDADITFIDALIKINEQTFIYTGILVDYELGKDGSLELITITQAQRKLVTGNDNGDYKDIRGNYLVLKYSDLININLSFIQFDEIIENGNITGVTARLLN